ncbi:MAG: gamma-glutamyltranspeptidase/glutathione hydrolase [Candidatus Azotimanducaceae bacterium]|jgi:gamma-glutamyltranspeptidase/glutathione hydrolase
MQRLNDHHNCAHKRTFMRYLVFVAFSILIPQLSAVAAQSSIIQYDTLHHPVIARHGMVVSQREIASQVGADILARGGNAVDAAVATGFALAVTLPRAGNLGGGGFMLIYLAETGKTLALDYREMAPALASRDMFLNAAGDVDQQSARYSALSAGVPGTVAGFAYALENYGTMSLAEVMKPAIGLAEKGFAIPWDQAEILKARKSALTRHSATAEAFYKADGSVYEAREILKQKDLAKTLKTIARQGPDAFYGGSIGKLIVAEMVRHGGLISLDDLKNYQVQNRTPVTGTYRGFDIVSMPPSSSGGVHVIEILNILEQYPIKDYGANSAQSIHLMTEAMKLAYADRSEYLGDQDFYDVPVKGLTSKAYAKKLVEGINMDKARPSSDIKPGKPAPFESPDTTHYSVADKFGNVVANTYTLNFSFGSGIMVTGAGFLLNNEMDDFSAKPGVPNGFGLIGREANAIQPGKRPLSSMTPTLIFKDNVPFIVTGSPGGSRIITTVLQLLVNVMDHDMNIAEATQQPRFHHQWLPDRLQLEPGHSIDSEALLKSMGHNVERSASQGSLQSIMIDKGLFFGASDARRPGAGAVGVD